MKKTSLALFCLCAFLGTNCGWALIEKIPTDISLTDKPATIKVLLGKKLTSFFLEAKGRYRVYNPITNLPITSGVFGKRGTCSLEKRGLRWGELFSGIFQIRLVPENSDSSLLINGIQYRGCVEVYPIGEHLYVINEVDIDSYLKSVLTNQFPNQMEEEAMAAVAIAARTHAFFCAHKNAHTFWHVDAQEVGYAGYGLTLQNLHADRAVEETRNIILTYEDAPFAATWNENSAGKTAPFSSIFRKSISSPQGVQSTYAKKDREKHRWSLTLSSAEFASFFGLAQTSGADLYTHSLSGKVYAVRLNDGSNSKDMSFFDLQEKLGKDKLLSNDFTLQVNQETVTITGYGEGHGVGLCLYSAMEMAKQGIGAKKILGAFFPHAKLALLKGSKV